MGLFDNLFMAADLVKGGIAAHKASERLDEPCDQAKDYYEELLTEDSKRLLGEYEAIKQEILDTTDTDKVTEITDRQETAAVAFLMSVAANTSISKKFAKDIQDALAEWKKANNVGTEIFEEYMMKQAKTDEERAEVRRALDEMAAEEEYRLVGGSSRCHPRAFRTGSGHLSCRMRPDLPSGNIYGAHRPQPVGQVSDDTLLSGGRVRPPRPVREGIPLTPARWRHAVSGPAPTSPLRPDA